METENRLVVARGVGGMGEGDQKVQTSSYKINKVWGWNVQHGDYSKHNFAHLKVVKRVDLKSSHCKQKNHDVNELIESLYCTP